MRKWPIIIAAALAVVPAQAQVSLWKLGGSGRPRERHVYRSRCTGECPGRPRPLGSCSGVTGERFWAV